jgi:pimeloyl-ACP methyl ester carboxylesterase
VLYALPELLAERVLPGPAVLVGHSAGGHLALWAAGRHRLRPGSRWYRGRPAGGRPHAVVAMAAMADLVRGSKEKLGDRAVDALLGGPPWRRPRRYAVIDPARLVPLGAPVTLVHGVADDRVPVEISRGYAARARAAGDTVELIELPDADHFAVIDPLSAAWPRVLGAITARVDAPYSAEQAVDGHG